MSSLLLLHKSYIHKSYRLGLVMRCIGVRVQRIMLLHDTRNDALTDGFL
jgi:hypothetical protein